MSLTNSAKQEFIAQLEPFNQLPATEIANLSEKLKQVRYRIGETLLMRDKIPNNIFIIYKGQARLLGYEPRSKKPETIEKLQAGSIVGACSLVRKVYKETAIASTELDCFILPAQDFLQLVIKYPYFGATFTEQTSLIEIYDLLGYELNRQADGKTDLKELALSCVDKAIIYNFSAYSAEKLDENLLWLISGGDNLPESVIGNRISFKNRESLPKPSSGFIRLLGIPQTSLPQLHQNKASQETIPYASEVLPPPDSLTPAHQNKKSNNKFPFVSGKGKGKATIACLEMVSKYLKVPFNQEIVRKVTDNQEKQGNISIQFCAALADLIGLQGQLVNINESNLTRIPIPALIAWEDSFAIVWQVTPKEITVAYPESGVKTMKLSTFLDLWGPSSQVLLLQVGLNTPNKKFGLSWFIPVLSRYRWVIIEVLFTSFFVQLFGLANPLMTQTIIDKVIIGNSVDTLQVLGILMVVMAAFEAILSSLRTNLFSDTTNRIDIILGTQVIDHLLRLPMSYFGRRSVGELASRISELEKIRQFLTGTALTVVLDAVFSFIYIGVMMLYSPLLTLVALGIVPFFIFLVVVFAPILRRMLRGKSERYGQTHAYLVEILSGIETVKSQGIELSTRSSWQERYARFIAAGFKATKLSSTLGALCDFLNKLSTLLVLWVGAYLVVKQELTLGELIGFRIIAGYVTSPLLRMSQLWQNFQETAICIESLGDILNNPQESPPEERNNLAMPAIKGAVTYENLSFRFAHAGPLQLDQVNIDIPAGAFVGIVGQSGSGKSTLTKLLPRFYHPLGGRILVDGYDINKVELYSLRSQMGIVPQNPLLFEGSIKENISLNFPDATTEEIIAAAEIADAHDFIMSFPNGYNSHVGERGANLSGGQRQRIAIARAVLQNPKLLIFDEATSALDNQTEQKVCLNVANNFKGRTVFFITHRLSSIKNADIILFMSDGKIVEQGTHQQLMALKGFYYCLYQ